MSDKYVTGEELDKTATPWQKVRLRLYEHEIAIMAGESAAGLFVSRSALLEAITDYANQHA